MTVYFISGLAADRTVFKNLQLPAGFIAHHLDWLPPLPAETLHQYAVRLAAGIDTRAPFALVGLSFGGMIAVEIANFLQPVCTILISSIKTAGELPFYYKGAGKLRLEKLVPVKWLQNLSLLKRLFSAETPTDKIILKNMIRRSDPTFIRWAVHAIVTWQSQTVPPNIFHIHGAQDLVLPLRFTKPTHVITGGHLLVLSHADTVNAILATVLALFVKLA